MNTKNGAIVPNKSSATGARYFLAAGVAVVLLASYFGLSKIFSSSYQSEGNISSANAKQNKKQRESEVFLATHLDTPFPLKGLYMTSWVAGTPALRQRILNLLSETELNAVVIDIKDDTGRISFEVFDPELQKIGSSETRIKDLRDFITFLHEKKIYVIGRISSFQDPYMVKVHPEWAVKRTSDGGIWKDRKGLSWVDPGAKPMWQYLALIGKEAYLSGFDELNYDYIRFPSDGNMRDIAYPYSENRIKSEVIKEYFNYLSEELRKTVSADGKKPVISADLFGMTTVASDGFDLNIGQALSDAFPYFDYIDPMVYPSHYPPNFRGYANPNTVPYEIVKISMDGAVSQAASFASNASTSPSVYIGKIRPWLQDFDYGGNYDIPEVRAQIQATYDAGLSNWLVWDAGNKYTRRAYIDENTKQ